MITKYPFPFLLGLVFFFLFACQPSIEEQIIGKWIGVRDKGYAIEFLKNGEVNIYNSEVKFNVGEDNQYIYNFIQKEDSLFLIIKGERTEVVLLKGLVHLEENFLLLTTYKSAFGIKNHFGEMLTCVREGHSLKKDTEVTRTKFFIPQGFIGTIYVAYNQVGGVAQKYDDDGNRLIEIPASGLVETVFMEDPLFIAKNSIDFFYERNELENYKGLNLIGYNELKKFFEENWINNLDSIYRPDAVVVVAAGYNQAGRDHINGLFSKKIQGNVEVYTVDTLRNIFQNF